MHNENVDNLRAYVDQMKDLLFAVDQDIAYLVSRVEELEEEVAKANAKHADEFDGLPVVSDKVVDQYVNMMDITEVVNLKSKAVYAKFAKLCKSSGYAPCTSKKFTGRVCKKFGLEVNGVAYKKKLRK